MSSDAHLSLDLAIVFPYYSSQWSLSSSQKTVHDVNKQRSRKSRHRVARVPREPPALDSLVMDGAVCVERVDGLSDILFSKGTKFEVVESSVGSEVEGWRWAVMVNWTSFWGDARCQVFKSCRCNLT